MSRVLRFYRLLNALSIDVVIGAIISAFFFARVHSVSLSAYIVLTLGLTVWIIYTIDHLRDAKRIRKSAATFRHYFHQRYFRPISYFLSIAVVIDVVTAWMLPHLVFLWGSALACGVLVNLLALRHLRLMKEQCVAVLYTAGIVLPTVAIARESLDLYSGLLSVQLCLLAFINLLIFSWFDRTSDQYNEQHSFVTKAGERFTRICIWILTGVALTMSACMQFAVNGQFLPATITAGMGFAFLLIFLFRQSLGNDEVHRLIGDAVFMIPILGLLWAK
jgi:hypothetical protein